MTLVLLMKRNKNVSLQIGQRFGRYTVLRKDEEKTDSRGRRDYYVCQCDCGVVKSVNKWKLILGTSKSCGCLMREQVKHRDTKHGLSRTRPYHIYYMIRKRCYSPSHVSYPLYGGRGIRMCDEWLNDPLSFIRWFEENGGNNKELSIDRIDVNGNYEPKNCRFATASEQQRNRRYNLKVTFRGKTYVLKDACEKFGIDYKKACSFYYYHKDDEALTRYFEERV